jgi:flavin reductase (DIM6/NTAB) family NADH-FMN oxidoreductase RutF
MRVSVGADQFRLTMGQLAGGVTIVTARDAGGRAWGMTASAVTSLSLVPPMLLVCIDRAAAIHDLLAGSAHFGINVLAEDQAEIARRFADRDRHGYDDHRGEQSPSGLPLVPGALAHVDVTRGPVHPGGDHSIITGTVTWGAVRDGRPLVYFRSAYTGLAP